MSFIKLPAKKPRKKLKLHINSRKVLRVVVILAVLAVLIGGTAAAWPWLKSKGVVPVADNERRDNLHASRDQQEYSELRVKELKDSEASLEDAEPAAVYSHYFDLATHLTAAQRYDEAEQAFLAAERTGYLKTNPAAAEGYYIDLGGMFEAQGDKVKARTQYQKARVVVEASDADADTKRLKLQEIDELIKRTENWL